MRKPPWNQVVLWLFLVWFLEGSTPQVQIVVTMTGTSYLNTATLPATYLVTVYDDTQILVEPCPSGTFSDDDSGVCRACSACIGQEYILSACATTSDTTCTNCTQCAEHQTQVCECDVVTPTCYSGNRVCYTSVAMTMIVNITLQSQTTLTKLQERFVADGLSTGYVEWLQTVENVPNATYDRLVAGPNRTYVAYFTLSNLYNATVLGRLETGGAAFFEQGLVYTFGSGVGRRRILTYAGGLVTALGSGTSCQSQEQCPQFTAQSTSASGCANQCVGMPCPPGFTGDFGTCTACPNATFKNSTGNATCTQCPSGYSSPQQAQNASQCFALPTTTGTMGTAGTTSTTTTTTVATTQPRLMTSTQMSRPITVNITTERNTSSQQTGPLQSRTASAAAAGTTTPTSSTASPTSTEMASSTAGSTGQPSSTAAAAVPVAAATTAAAAVATGSPTTTGGGGASATTNALDVSSPFAVALLELMAVSMGVAFLTALISGCACGYLLFRYREPSFTPARQPMQQQDVGGGRPVIRARISLKHGRM